MKKQMGKKRKAKDEGSNEGARWAPKKAKVDA